MAKKSIIKKQHITILVIVSIFLAGFAIFGKSYFSKLTFGNKFHTCTYEDGTIFETTEPCENYLPKKENLESSINLNYDKPQSVQMVAHQGKYFSTKYPKNWYEWYGGTGISLDIFQINNVPESLAEEQSAHIDFQVTEIGYFGDYSKSVSEYIKNTKITDYQIIKIDDVDFLYYERLSDCCVMSSLFSVYNNAYYIVNMTISGSTIEERDANYIKNRYVLDVVLDNFKFND